MRITLFSALCLIAWQTASASHHHVHRDNHPHIHRDIFSQLASAASSFFDPGNDTPTSTTTKSTLKGAPVTATQTSSATSNTKTKSATPTQTSQTVTTIPSTSVSTESTAKSKTVTSTASSISITSSSSDSSSTTSSSTSSISSSSTSSSSIPVPSNPANLAPTQTSSPQTQSSNGISSAGIAVAVIFSLIVLAVISWLFFRHHPRCRAWYAARQEKKYKERSYRDALDGPNSLRANALSDEGEPRRGRKSTYLASFFAPRTVQLGDGREIRRKPVQWGIRDEEEKVPMAELASPMGRSPADDVSMPLPARQTPRMEKPLPRIQERRISHLAELP